MVSSVPARTDNRIRSPRLQASGLRNDASKGSRQARSVTSGKGLALRVGPDGSVEVPRGGAASKAPRPRAGVGGPGRPRGSEADACAGAPERLRAGGGAVVRRATNGRSRTGTDRENPTV